ncbi:MAG: DUF2812 domain-containing protein [Eubacteriaceae bacterium]|jgi:hypothetical protein|nr:DUF2812 domain-containing protein [Eubacteriaceae bacterium]
MGQIVRKFNYLSEWRIGETESWLSNMPSKGLLFERFEGKAVFFRRSEPAAIRYRIRYSFLTQEAQYDSYAKSGRAHLGSYSNRHVYSSKESEMLPEIHAGPATQREMLIALENKLATMVLLRFLLLLAVLLFSYLITYGELVVFGLAQGAKQSYAMLFTICIAFLYTFRPNGIIALSSLVRLLRRGRVINHSAEWKIHYNLSKAVSYAF